MSYTQSHRVSVSARRTPGGIRLEGPLVNEGPYWATLTAQSSVSRNECLDQLQDFVSALQMALDKERTAA